MQVDTLDQAEAITRLKKLERVSRLLEIAKGRSAVRGRALFLIRLAFGALLALLLVLLWTTADKDALLAVLGKGEMSGAMVLVTVALFAAGLTERLGRRIDAVVELLELHGIPSHGSEQPVMATTAAEEGARR